MASAVAIVLEDQLLDQAQARSALEAAGFEVYVAATVVEGFELISSWLAPERDLSDTKVLVVVDLLMDIHGLHIVAMLRNEQLRGRLLPAPLVILTSGASAENMHFARLAGCDGIFQKPLTPETAERFLTLQPALTPLDLSDEDAWLRSWLIGEGDRILSHYISKTQLPQEVWTSEDVDYLLKELSGRGWRPTPGRASELVVRLGGDERARSLLVALAPQLGAPFDGLLRHVLSGASIEESGRRMGYGRSHSYQLFRRMVGRLSRLLGSSKASVVGARDQELGARG